ncbi:MAG: hypothetical protein JSU63_03335 [Phycisphaerales bacterium]|nr:MAG: hypothetical protein JSU63_03335 [Phycisphaerales bacterium]
MQTVLFLQELGVEREVVRETISRAGLPFAPVWEDWRKVESPEAVAAIVTVKTAVPEEMLERFPNARMIAVAFTGYDCVDLDLCRRRAVAVYNVPAYSTDSVAELTLGLTICLLRDIPAVDRKTRAGDWKAERWGTELAGRTVGIIGTGAIGLRVAELFRACKCELIGWSRRQRDQFISSGGIYKSMEEVLSQADVVSLHLALNAETEGVIGEKELALMKPGACLINTARGRLVDKGALGETLSEGRIRAGIDVYDQEPPPADDALLDIPNTVLTSHIAFKTYEALLRRVEVTVDNIAAFLQGSDSNRIA